MRPTRICVDGRYLENPSFGISVYLLCVLRALSDADTEIDLIVRRPLHGVDLPPSIRVVQLAGRNSLIWEQWRAARHLNAHQYDGYLCPSNFGLPVFAPRRTHMMLTIHDLIPMHFPSRYLYRRPRWAVRYLSAIAVSAARADAIFTPSVWAADDVRRRLHRHAESVTTNVRAIDGQGSPQSVTEPVEAPTPYLLYNGGRDPRKNVDVLLESFAQLVEQHPGCPHVLKLMGPGYESSVRSVPPLIRARIELLGFVPEHAKSEIVAQASAIVYPSSMEGFGLPIIEGLLAGIPVICGVGGGQRELGGTAVVYVDPINVETLYSALRDVVIYDLHPTAAEIEAQAQRVADPAQSAIVAETLLRSIRDHGRASRRAKRRHRLFPS